MATRPPPTDHLMEVVGWFIMLGLTTMSILMVVFSPFMEPFGIAVENPKKP